MYLENQEIISLLFVFQKSGRSERLRSAIWDQRFEIRDLQKIWDQRTEIWDHRSEMRDYGYQIFRYQLNPSSWHILLGHTVDTPMLYKILSAHNQNASLKYTAKSLIIIQVNSLSVSW